MKRAICFWALAFSCFVAMAEDKLAIPTTIQSTEECKKVIGDDGEKTISRTVNAALSILKRVPPKEGDHLFNWKNKEQLKDKKVAIVLVNSDDELLKKVTKGHEIPESTDAVTVTVVDEGKLTIYLFLVVDKMFFDGKEERDDAFGRMTSAMALAFYGEIPNKLKMPVKDLEKKQTFEQRKAAQVSAYEATIAFFERLKADKFYDTFTKEEKAIFEKRLAFNKAGLEAWKERKEKE